MHCLCSSRRFIRLLSSLFSFPFTLVQGRTVVVVVDTVGPNSVWVVGGSVDALGQNTVL